MKLIESFSANLTLDTFKRILIGIKKSEAITDWVKCSVLEKESFDKQSLAIT